MAARRACVNADRPEIEYAFGWRDGRRSALAKLDALMGTVTVNGTITGTTPGFDPNAVDTAGMTMEANRG